MRNILPATEELIAALSEHFVHPDHITVAEHGRGITFPSGERLGFELMMDGPGLWSLTLFDREWPTDRSRTVYVGNLRATLDTIALVRFAYGQGMMD